LSSRVLVSLRVKATPQRAFDVFVGQIGSWWKDNELFWFSRRRGGRVAIEGGLGGRFTETYADGTVFEIGRVTTWEPGARLGLTWRQESFAPEQETRVDVRFERVGDETRVTVEHSGWDAIPDEHVARHGFPNAVFLQRLGEWWRALLGRLPLE
jgi:Activator of Hsp90 ATPase homolog 1-like protein